MGKRSHSQHSGFTLVEVLVSLLLTITGLAGVMFMQAETVRNNRRSAQFSRALNLAEEVMETTRGTTMTTLLAGVAYDPVVINSVAYQPTVQTTEHSTSTNLVLVRVTVRYDEEGDAESSADDRTASVEMLRTKTELL